MIADRDAIAPPAVVGRDRVAVVHIGAPGRVHGVGEIGGARQVDGVLEVVLLEIQARTGFVSEFTHISEGAARVTDLTVSLCAVLLAKMLRPILLRVAEDRSYDDPTGERVFADVAEYLSFIGGVVVRRAWDELTSPEW